MVISIISTNRRSRTPPKLGLRRLIGTLAVLSYAALAGASGLDRLAREHFWAERLVPEPFRVDALARAAERLIEAGIPGSALTSARKLVARDPLGLGSAALLGAALLGHGERATADRAFRLSARRGWRDARTQLYWLRTALAQGDPGLAALRFGALARQWPQAPAIGQMAAAFEATPEGRLALAQRIAAGDRWGRSYAQPADDLPAKQLAGRAQVLLLAADLGTKLGCEPVAPLVRRLAEIDPFTAAQLWHGHCPTAPVAGTLADPGFAQAQLTGALTPFAWEFPGDGALALSFVGGKAGRALEVVNSGSLTLAFAAQRLPLAAGTYRLTMRRTARAEVLRASLSCRRELSNAEPQQFVAGAVELQFSGDCPAPWLQLWVAPGAGPARLAELSLTPL